MIGKLLGGRYEILEQIGGGGMALVYKARCRLLNRYVAIKVLRDEFVEDIEFVEKFRMESQAAASLSHPNIVNIYDVGTDEYDGKTTHYIVMEYIKGVTLKEKIKKEGKLSIGEAIEYSKEVASALREAHRNNIIHRDIKPQNIMVDENNRIKVMDFGIARAATSSTIASTTEVLGSVHYFSPEQARGGYTDERSDIYSLGIVMYEMVTGELPYKGESPITIALKHVQEDMLPPRELEISIPKGLEEIILRSTEKRQVDRYKDIDQVMDELNKVELDYKESISLNTGISSLDDTSSHTRVLSTDEIKRETKKVRKKKKKKNKENLKGSILGMLAAFILMSLAFFGRNQILGLFKTEEFVMPDLIDMTESEAKDRIRELELEFEIKRKPVSDRDPGKVISQDPVAETKLKKGYPVELVVSESGGSVTVPSFLNKNIYEAETIARRLKLKLNPKYINSEMEESGIILSQEISEGSSVESGTVINVSVSQGKEKSEILMPGLIGKSLDEAKKEIEASGLKLGNVDEENSDKPKGSVIWQSHKSGAELNKNTLIHLKLSNGKADKPEEDKKEDKEPEKDKDKDKTKEPKEKSVELTINVVKDGTAIKVERTQNGETSTVYNQVVAAGDVRISTSGLAGAKFDIYADGALVDSVVKQ